MFLYYKREKYEENFFKDDILVMQDFAVFLTEMR